MTSYNINPSRQEALLNAAAAQDAKRYGLGHRPPADSLASAAQAVADINEKLDVPPSRMTRKEEARLEGAAAQDALRVQAEKGKYINVDVNPLSLSKDEAIQIQSEEHRMRVYSLGYPPPAGSLAAQTQSLTDRLENASTQPMTKDIASDLMSLEHHGMGYTPSGSIAAEAQSKADKNENDGGNRTMNPAVMRVAMGAPVSKGIAAKVMAEENAKLGEVPRGSIAAQAQAAADKNVMDGGNRGVYDD
ncbi:hypothetical protein Clacol_003430 [Clathrus columnatus]|uniref:SMP domain-containing protein n=1 Tax=Clathrus columnatus TaxID=1419009 RepID=A0AAV5A978_9AGAM|nr:hypothetical protein Clacol_003430 [Clathrus columnatus]